MTSTPRVLPGIGHLDTLANTSTLAFDTETTGLMPTYGGLRLIQLAGPGTDIVVIDCWELEEHDWFTLENFFAQERTWIAHNAVFDLGWLQVHDIHPQGKVICTMLASRLHRNGVIGSKHGLAACAQYYLKEEVDKTQQTSDWSQPTLSQEQIEYASKDARLVLRLWDALLPRLTHGALLPALALECSALPALAALNRTGMPFDRDSLVALEESYTQEIQALGERFVHDLDAALPPEEKLPRLADGSFNLNAKATGSVRLGNKVPAGFNLNAPAQLVAKFKILLGEAPISPKTGKPSAAKEALRGYAADSPVVQTYLAWKRAEKRRQMVRALVDHLDADGFVKAQYIQLGADTGRMSCRTPNLQQVPRDKGFRNAAKSPPGWKFVVADFGQMELRLAAAVSKDRRMIEAFKAQDDLHAITAAAIYPDPSEDKDVLKARRQTAKACFSGDTEVLTPSGWVRLDQWSGQQVMQYTPPLGVDINYDYKTTPGRGYVGGRRGPWDGNFGALQFVQPEDYRSFWSDDVWLAEDRNVSICATGNHNIFYINAYGQAKLVPLSNVSSPRLFVGAGYLRKEYRLSPIKTRVLCMVAADGSFKQQKGYVTLGFSKARKIKRCKLLLDQAGIEYKRGVAKNGEHGDTSWFKFPVAVAPWLLDYVTPDKELVLDTCMRELDVLVYLEEAQYWDGSVVQGEKRDRVFVSTVVKQAADVMQIMAVTSGIVCTQSVDNDERYSTGSCYKVSYPFGIPPAWRASWDPQPAAPQEVYCVQVPSGLLMIRHNSKVSVQGNCNFGLLYGSGAKGLRDYAGSMGITMTLDEAKEIRDKFHATYTGISTWQQQCGREADETKGNKWAQVLIPGSGLRRYLPGDLNRITTRCNTPIQGAGAAVLKLALANLWPHLRQAGEDKVRLVGVVHDEIALLVRDGLEETWCQTLSQVMEEAESRWLGDIPPLAEAAWGDSWGEAK